MKIVKTIAVILLIGLVGIQFIPTKQNHSNSVPETDFLLLKNPPKNIRGILQVSCYDCHSNNTKYPWYNKVQPVAWFLENHIKKGKKELNFNEWGNYSSRKKNSRLNSIIDQIKDNEMPLFSYTLVHRGAVLSKAEKELLIEYMKNLKDSLK